MCPPAYLHICADWSVHVLDSECVCVEKETFLPKSSCCPAHCVFFLYFLFVLLYLAAENGRVGGIILLYLLVQPTGTLLLARAGEQTHKHAQTQTNQYTIQPTMKS